MKHYYCHRANETIVFDAIKIFFCCATRVGPGILAKDSINNIKYILEERKKLIKRLAWGDVPEECKGCFDLKETNFWTIFKKIKKPSKFVIKHFKQCDCQCIYCSEQYLSKRKIVPVPKKSDYYDLLPVLQEMYKRKIIDETSTEVIFQGGNISVLEEFDDLVRLLTEHNVKKIEIATNGIKYLPIIEEVCKKTHIRLYISIDCGCRETFKKLKIVDGFDSLVANLRKYKTMPVEIILKYILIKGVNDNKEEIDKYIDLMADIGVNVSELTIDQCDSDFDRGNGFIIPEHYYELFDYWKQKCKKLKIATSVWSYIQEVLNRKSFFR